MKIQIIVFVLVIFLGNLSAQNAGWELADGTGGYFTALHEEENGDLIAAMAPKNNLTKIVKLDKNGVQVAENYVFADSLNISIYRIVYFKSIEKYMLFGSSNLKNQDESFSRYFIVAILESNLSTHILKVTKFDVLGALFNMDFLLTDTEILLSVNVYNDGMGPNSEQIFLRINKDGDIISSQIDRGFNCYSIVKLETGFQCFGVNTKYFNKDFELIRKDNKFIPIFRTTNQNRALRIDDDKILVGSLPYQIPEIATGGAVLYFVDNEFNILKKNWIKTSMGTTLPGNVFDISPDSSIFIANFEAFIIGLKSFSIGKFDTDLDLIWQIKYENIGKYRYPLWGMEATNDNGIILYGSRRNWNDFNDAEAYMIKFNSEGKITWTQNVDATDLVAIRIFPNPSSGPLTVDIIGITGKADIRVFDMSGRNVYVRDGITDGSTTLDLSALASGSYMYKIYQGSKEISSGKWIKM